MSRLLQVSKIQTGHPVEKGIELKTSVARKLFREYAQNVSIGFLRWQAYFEEDIKNHPNDYEIWLKYALCVEAYEYSETLIRDKYKRATSNVPTSVDKDSWRTYISIWIAYAFYEELKAKDIERARKVYTACIGIIPHTTFTFSKIWLMYAQFEQRNNNLQAARSILNQAIDICPRNKLYHGYIKMETELGEYDKCRIVYGKFLEFQPKDCNIWIDFAKMETALDEFDRAHTIFTLALKQSCLDTPELLRKAYDEFASKHGSPSSCIDDPIDAMAQLNHKLFGAAGNMRQR